MLVTKLAERYVSDARQLPEVINTMLSIGKVTFYEGVRITCDCREKASTVTLWETKLDGEEDSEIRHLSLHIS